MAPLPHTTGLQRTVPGTGYFQHAHSVFAVTESPPSEVWWPHAVRMGKCASSGRPVTADVTWFPRVLGSIQSGLLEGLGVLMGHEVPCTSWSQPAFRGSCQCFRQSQGLEFGESACISRSAPGLEYRCEELVLGSRSLSSLPSPVLTHSYLVSGRHCPCSCLL